MKKFIIQLTGFSLFVLIVAFAMQWLLTTIANEKSLNEVDNLVQMSNVNADLVLLGSSRCWVHFDPRFFADEFNVKTVNIGVDGHSELSMTFLRLTDYLSRNKPPKFAILNFDPLINANEDQDNIVHKDHFARYAFFPTMNNKPFVDYFKFTAAERYVPLYAVFKYRLLDDYIKSVNKKKPDPLAGHLVDKVWDTLKNPVSDDIKKHYFKQQEIAAVKRSLQKLKKICEENNCKLLCIQTPVYKVLDNNRSFAYTKSICAELDIPFIDINRDVFKNDINNFYSPSHLNKDGVIKMNALLKNDPKLAEYFRSK